MRMSCNGCRVLRKGCTDGCSIRPCLQWIKNPEAQANATVFLAKFYGRAGLLNLVNTGPDHLRPHIFQSLLYEACGRIVNPIYGSVGLLWSGNWQMCQAAVEAVLKGQPIVQVSSDAAAAAATPPLKAYDIRHVAKDHANDSLHKVAKPGRHRFKRASSSSASKPKPAAPQPEQEAAVHAEDGFVRAPSHESWASHDHVDNAMSAEEAHHEASVDTDVEGAGSHVSQAEQSPLPLVQTEDNGDGEVSLELTLGLAPVARTRPAA